MHIFTHRSGAYLFDPPTGKLDRAALLHRRRDAEPSSDPAIRRFIRIEKEWRWSGTHYQRTALDWLANFNSRRDEIEGIFRAVYGSDTAFGCGAGAGSPRRVGIVRLRRRQRMGRQSLPDEGGGLIAVFCRSTQRWNPIRNPVNPQKRSASFMITACDIGPPANRLHRSRPIYLSVSASGRLEGAWRFQQTGAIHFMSGLRARSACVAMMLAAFAPLLAGCDESSIRDRHRATHRTRRQHRHRQAAAARRGARVARPHRADARCRRAPASLRHHGRAPVPPGQRGQGGRSALSHRSTAVRG